ncbi:hypothetical protein B0T20DRAFT_451129 [Sordaria brevicollis]|uniref:Uncharacterized protein n=1 Tax=Sordaria brevicollis TaxID=83679 RepID=A0AAE0PLU9_SORBR|nr:hypothetical protein B0T20DRAFT_451129 [Sordaria brevicollis]
MDMMDPPSTATIDDPLDVPSLSDPTAIFNNDVPVQFGNLDKPNTLPPEPCHQTTKSSLKRPSTYEDCPDTKRQELTFPPLETSEHNAYGENAPVAYSSWEEGETEEHRYADTLPYDFDGWHSAPYTKAELLELSANNPYAGREDCEETDGSFFSRAMIFDTLTGGNPEAYSGEQAIFIPRHVSSHEAAPAIDGGISSNNKTSDDDHYSITSSDKEVMNELVDSSPDNLAQIPPSSVIREVQGSSTPEIFDPRLQRSPPGSTPKTCSALEGQIHPGDPENLVDENIDWEEVFQHQPIAPANPNTSQSEGTSNNTNQALENAIEWMQSRSISPVRYQPFTRPAYPCPLLNKSPAEGLSNAIVMRTCFRLGSVFKEAAQSLRVEPEVTFELFARVASSSRKNGSRVQQFEFIDLFEDHPPHLTGVLTRWKNDSLVEKEAAGFLDEPNNKMCRCMCRPKKTKEAERGWDLQVLRIRVTDWSEIESVKGVICYE